MRIRGGFLLLSVDTSSTMNVSRRECKAEKCRFFQYGGQQLHLLKRSSSDHRGVKLQSREARFVASKFQKEEHLRHEILTWIACIGVAAKVRQTSKGCLLDGVELQLRSTMSCPIRPKRFFCSTKSKTSSKRGRIETRNGEL